MSPTLDSLTTQALALPPEQRIILAERLWTSVEDPLDDDELMAEIQRREAEVAAGRAIPIPFDQAMREVRESLK
jgi:putative addiction module component (TIGR02574 family)